MSPSTESDTDTTPNGGRKAGAGTGVEGKANAAKDGARNAAKDEANSAESGSESTESAANKRRGAAVVTTPTVPRSAWGRLINSMTAIDFIGRRRIGFTVSVVLIIATFASLFLQGLNLGIDFEGGVSWEIPTTEGFTQDEAKTVLEDNNISTEGARIQTREVSSADGSNSGHEFIKVQVGEQPVEVGEQMRPIFAEAADVNVNDVNVALVSSSWGQQITDKAIRALIIFLIVVAIFISIRFEWRMAVAAIAAMAHDVIISVGIYSIFQFAVTPATVIAFLTILGYSLYDTIVVFDRVRENEVRFVSKRASYDDIINVSMNQVLMRSLTTSFSSIVPVIALLIIGAGIMGVSALSDFAVALLVGMVTGAYSSIFVASPLLGLLKRQDPAWKSKADLPRATGETLRAMVISGTVPSRRRGAEDEAAAPTGRAAKRGSAATGDNTSRSSSAAGSSAPGSSSGSSSSDGATSTAITAEELLQHKPRPRKKTRR